MGRSRRQKLPQEPVIAEIESLSHDGRGVTHTEGKAVFIPGVLPGETIKYRYTRRQKKHDEGVLLEVLTASPDRIEPECPHFGICGGCSLQHQAPEAQLRAKQAALMDALQRIGKVAPVRPLSPLGSPDSFGYRRKARLGAKYVRKKERVLVGFRERGQPYIADLSVCHVLHPKVGQLIEPLSQLIDSLTIRERVPQIEVAIDDQQCVLVFRILSVLSDEDRERLRTFGTMHDLHVYLQDAGPDSVQPLGGEPVDLQYHLPAHDITIHFLPNDFTQVNSGLNHQMIDQALGLLEPESEDRVLDLFCGLGNFTLPIARQVKEVVGVEGDAGLVARARENARLNDIQNSRYYTANLYGELNKEPWIRERFNKALLDPPRSGAFEVLEHLPKLGIQRIVYVSCYPGTLARDAGELVHRHGYKLLAAGVMDMFPHTAHVESIALFEKP